MSDTRSMTIGDFERGFTALLLAFGREDSKELRAVYRAAIKDQFSSAKEWHETILEVIRTREFFPPPAALLASRSGASVDELAVEAGKLFSEIEKHGAVYNSHGSYYCAIKIRRVWGDEAVEAFKAAGASSAFMSTDARDLGFTRSAFVKAYAVTKKAARRRQLPEATELLRLISGKET